jgi:hypothetical protein
VTADRLVAGGDRRGGVGEDLPLRGEQAGGPENRSAVVKSPQTRRRKALMLGSRTPNRFSMILISEVWSSRSEQTPSPTDHGDTGDGRHPEAGPDRLAAHVLRC